jgi:hypothetical protein
MTTIIMVIIGVLIAAAAALFVIFYGGSAFGESDEKSEATRLVNEGVQIEAAFKAFRVQEDRTPGSGNNNTDDPVMDLVCNDYLTSVPAGGNPENVAVYNCENRTLVSGAAPWKIDYNRGIARSIVGSALNEDGSQSRAYSVCQQARQQIGLSGEPLRCDDQNISNREPCCLMTETEASQ